MDNDSSELSMAIELPGGLSAQVERLAKRRHKSPSGLIADIVAGYFEDLEDYRDAAAAKKKGGKTHSIEEVKAHLGL